MAAVHDPTGVEESPSTSLQSSTSVREAVVERISSTTLSVRDEEAGDVDLTERLLDNRQGGQPDEKVEGLSEAVNSFSQRSEIKDHVA